MAKRLAMVLATLAVVLAAVPAGEARAETSPASAAKAAGVDTVVVPIRGVRPHERARFGVIQIGFLAGLPLCMLIDLCARPTRWSIPILDIWRSAAAFAATAWRHIPVPLALLAAGYIASYLAAHPSGALWLVYGLALLAIGVGYLATVGGAYRLALAAHDLPAPPQWGVRIGRVEFRLLGALVMNGAAWGLTYVVFRAGCDVIAGSTHLTDQLDLVQIHFGLIGASNLVAGAAMAMVGPTMAVGGKWTLKSVLAQTRGAWLPIAMAKVAYNLVLFAGQALSAWAKGAALSTAGLTHGAMIAVAFLLIPALYALMLPFGAAVNVRLFALLSPVGASGDVAAVFD